MISITMKLLIGEDRRLDIELPDEIPAGPIELTITTATSIAEPFNGSELTREQLKVRLATDGLLGVGPYAPPGAVRLTDAERAEVGRVPAGTPDTSTLIDEDRDGRWH